MEELYKQHCINLQYKEKYRQLQELIHPEHPTDYLNFSTNDYLNFSNRYELLEAAKRTGTQFGVGATGSRLISGNKKIFIDLEKQIATDKNTEAALIFNSGFQANISVLSSLLDQTILKCKPIVFFDKLNHSSLYQAVFLSGAELVRYQHNNLDHLNSLLVKFQTTPRKKFIVTETIFGMDGDLLPIKEILTLAEKFNAFLYLDEAHATGIIGNNGYGLSTTVNLNNIPHLIMGTFSKALGCCGAYIASSAIIKNYLINKAPGFIYSTALSPMIVGAMQQAWNLVKTLDKERKKLLKQANNLKISLNNLGFNVGNTNSHIIPIILGTELAVINAKKFLLTKKIIVAGLRPPTVLPGTSRLRIALNINHNNQDINRLILALKAL